MWCNTCLKYTATEILDTHTDKHVCVGRAIFLQEYDVLILMSVQINEHTVSRFVHKDPSISYSNTLQHIPKKAIHHSIVILQRYTRQLYIFCGPSYLTVKQSPTTRRNSFILPSCPSLSSLPIRLGLLFIYQSSNTFI